MVHTELNVPGKNHLIESLPEPERTRLMEKCDTLTLAAGSMLFQANRPIEAAYFPLTGMVSLVGTTEEGHAIEVGTIGNEGIAGGFIALGSDRSASAGMVQCSGDFLRIMVEDLCAELGRSRALNEIVQRFAHALTNQISQSLVCNQTHPIEERICRWLLMAHDRVGRDELDLTQEFIAQMLGIRRPTVTVVAGLIQKAGLTRYSRGRITILDRQGLQDGACECYDIVRREAERLLSAPTA